MSGSNVFSSNFFTFRFPVAPVARPLILIAAMTGCSFAQADLSDVAPAAACRFLSGTGLPTTLYAKQSDGGFRCISPQINIGHENYLTYQVDGSETATHAIGLKIAVEAPAEAAAIHRRLKDVAVVLAQKLGSALPDTIAQAIAEGRAVKATADRRSIAVIRTALAGDRYTLNVVFE